VQYRWGVFDPTLDPIAVYDLLPFIAITTWPRQMPGDPSPGHNVVNPDDWAGDRFVHEVAHITGLWDEYELPRSRARQDLFFSMKNPEPLAPNITSLKTILSASSTVTISDLDSGIKDTVDLSPKDIDVNKIKWIDLIEHPKKIVVMEHPPIKGNDQEYQDVLDAAKRSILFLIHIRTNTGEPKPWNVDYSKSPSGAVPPVLKGKKLLLDLASPNLIEGGLGFPAHVFRPTPEQCIMRNRGYKQTIEGGGLKWVSHPFCKVCFTHIRSVLYGVYNYRYGGARIVPGPPQVINFRYPSILAKEFVTFVENTKLAYSGGIFENLESLHLRYVNFIKSKSLDLTDVKFPTPKPKIVMPTWGDSYIIKYPILPKRGTPHLFHYLWINDLEKQRKNNVILQRLAATGPVGVMILSGFGTPANRMFSKMESGNDEPIQYFVGLTESELENLKQGSLLQIWRSKDDYEQSVRYVAKEKTDESPPQNPNETLIFMGKDSNGVYRVADNQGTQRDLKNDWPDFKFWIGSQWYDIA